MGRRRFAAIQDIITASDLHERAFAEKAQLDAEKLSLAQMQFLQQRADQQERLSLARARFQVSYKNKLSAAAAVERLSVLDPRSPTYQKERGQILSTYAEGVDNPSVKSILEEQDKAFTAFGQAQTARQAATFTGPANDAWKKAYDSSGDMIFANKVAENTQLNLTRAQKLTTDPHLDASLRSKIYDPNTGQFNTDPTLLTQADVDIQTKVNQSKLANSQTATISALDGVLKTLGTASSDESPQAKAIRFNALEALKTHTFNLKNSAGESDTGTTLNTPAAPDTAAGNELQSLLGNAPEPDDNEEE